MSRLFGVMVTGVAAATLAAGCALTPGAGAGAGTGRPAPAPEAVSIERLPLPPTAPGGVGTCTTEVNPNGTGCIDPGRSIDGARSFSPDGSAVYASIRFAGAPTSGPSSVYAGGQLILVKTDGTTFPNGDGWKCVTCGVPAENRVGANNLGDNTYPEAFADGTRVKMGQNILDCGPHDITDPLCTPEATHIYPIKSPFPPGAGIFREIRLHPDDVHLGWNQLYFSSDFTAASELGVFGRLVFDPTPASGAPGYELTDVTFLASPELGGSGRFFSVKKEARNGKPAELTFEKPTGVIGEFRGFTPDGKSALGIGTRDSFNYDIFATSLETGKSTRLSRDPAYTDPVNISPDGRSMVIMDGRVTEETGLPGANPAGTDGRMYFASAGPGVPPLIDLAIAEAVGNLYTGPRGSFLQPYLIDLTDKVHERDPEIHDGQQLNAGYDPTAGSGSISDPTWTAGADPAWSPDGTAVVYYQRRFCDVPGGCVTDPADEGRQARLMIARLTDRAPTAPLPQPEPVSDAIPWGIPYTAGDQVPPSRPVVPAGTYVLDGKKGSAEVVVTTGPSRFRAGDLEVTSVAVTYDHYSADGVNIVDGTESGTRGSSPAGRTLTWHADLTFSGLHSGTRRSSEPGGFVVTAQGLAGGATISGSLTTTLDGVTFDSPT